MENLVTKCLNCIYLVDQVDARVFMITNCKIEFPDAFYMRLSSVSDSRNCKDYKEKD